MEQIHGFPFAAIELDRGGTPTDSARITELTQHVAAAAPTDVIFIAHGWRNSAFDARALYTAFLASLRTNLQRPDLTERLRGRTFAVAGVFWPSKTFPEQVEDVAQGGVAGIDDDPDAEALADVHATLEELARDETDESSRRAIARAQAMLPVLDDSPASQDAFASELMLLLENAAADPTEGLDRVLATPGHELFDKLASPLVVPVDDDDESEGGSGGTTAVPDAFGEDDGEGEAADFRTLIASVGHRANRMVNFTTWYLMKDRAGTVGAAGLAPVVRTLADSSPQTRIHLVGHSLGGRLVASAAKALAAPPVVRISTLTLLQAAFSHYGLSKDNGRGEAGFFREVIAGAVVRGPILATHSRKDLVVGKTYALASRLAGDNVRATGDEQDQYGGIGRNGAQQTDEREQLVLGQPGQAYAWKAGRIHNLRGDDVIDDHSDVTGEEITYAFASALTTV